MEEVDKGCLMIRMVWVSECFFWYWSTWVVPDKRPLKSCVCVCVHVSWPQPDRDKKSLSQIKVNIWKNGKLVTWSVWAQLGAVFLICNYDRPLSMITNTNNATNKEWQRPQLLLSIGANKQWKGLWYSFPQKSVDESFVQCLETTKLESCIGRWQEEHLDF